MSDSEDNTTSNNTSVESIPKLFKQVPKKKRAPKSARQIDNSKKALVKAREVKSKKQAKKDKEDEVVNEYDRDIMSLLVPHIEKEESIPVIAKQKPIDNNDYSETFRKLLESQMNAFDRKFETFTSQFTSQLDKTHGRVEKMYQAKKLKNSIPKPVPVPIVKSNDDDSYIKILAAKMMNAK